MGGKFKSHLTKIKFRRLHTWQLILILIPLLFLTATFLRLDHIKSNDLREIVEEADREGDDEKTAAALEDLSDFVRHNIVVNIVEENGNNKIIIGTVPVFLQESYNRAANQAIESAVANLSEPSQNVFELANNVCQPQAIQNGWSWNHPDFLACMTGEIDKYPSSENLSDVIIADIPPTDLYRKDFFAPIWAPTLSGFSILLCIILIVVIFIRFLIWVVIRLSLLFI